MKETVFRHTTDRKKVVSRAALAKLEAKDAICILSNIYRKLKYDSPY